MWIYITFLFGMAMGMLLALQIVSDRVPAGQALGDLAVVYGIGTVGVMLLWCLGYLFA